MRVLHLLPGGTRGGAETLNAHYMKESRHQHTYCALFLDGPILDEIEDEIEVIRLASFNMPQKRKKLMELVQSGAFDIVISHQWFGKPAILLNSIDFGDTPLVIVLHSCYEPERGIRSTWLMRQPTKRLYKKADAVVAISKFVKRNHLDSFDSRANINVIYNGVDIERFGCHVDLTRPLSKPLNILYLGRLETVKGVHILIQACAELSKLGVPYCAQIVGWGSQEKMLKRLSKELGVNAEFYGETLRPEVFCRNADVFVHGALWQEGFGLALVEAMAAGCICIASRTGGIPEIIEDGLSGFLVDSGDVVDLTSRLQRTADMSYEETVEMRQAAKRRSQDFSLDKYTREYDLLIETIVFGRK